MVNEEYCAYRQTYPDISGYNSKTWQVGSGETDGLYDCHVM